MTDDEVVWLESFLTMLSIGLVDPADLARAQRLIRECETYRHAKATVQVKAAPNKKENQT